MSRTIWSSRRVCCATAICGSRTTTNAATSSSTSTIRFGRTISAAEPTARSTPFMRRVLRCSFCRPMHSLATQARSSWCRSSPRSLSLGCGAWRLSTRAPLRQRGSITLAVAGSATWFLHSFTIFPDPVGAACVAAALIVLTKLDASPAGGDVEWQLLGAGACLACLPWLHTRFVVVAVAIGAVIALRLIGRWRATADLCGAPRGFRACVVRLLLRHLWHAEPVRAVRRQSTKRARVACRLDSPDWRSISSSVWWRMRQCLRCSPGESLGLWRLRPRLAMELTAIAVPYVARRRVVWHVVGWLERASQVSHLLVAADGAAPGCRMAARESAVRAMFVALTLIGGANVDARVAALRRRVALQLSRRVRLAARLGVAHREPAAGVSQRSSTWGRRDAVARQHLAHRGRRRAACIATTRWSVRSNVAARWAVTSWLIVLCSSLALSASWTAARTEPLTPESSKIDFVQRWNPDRRPLAVRLPSWETLSPESALASITLASSVRARDLPQQRPLLALTRVPAGEYRLVVEGSRDLQGTLTVSVGSTSQTLERWSLAGAHAGDTSFVLQLPTLVHSVTITGDALARSHVTQVSLRPGAHPPVSENASVRSAGHALPRCGRSFSTTRFTWSRTASGRAAGREGSS